MTFSDLDSSLSSSKDEKGESDDFDSSEEDPEADVNNSEVVPTPSSSALELDHLLTVPQPHHGGGLLTGGREGRTWSSGW